MSLLLENKKKIKKEIKQIIIAGIEIKVSNKLKFYNN